MTRRKSRPLLPHEVASFRSSQESVEDAMYSSFSMDESSQQQPWSSQSSIYMSQPSPAENHILPPSKASDQEQAPSGLSNLDQSPASPLDITPKPTQPIVNTRESVSSVEIPVESSDKTASFSRVPSPNPDIAIVQKASMERGTYYMANRRSAPFSIYQEGQGEVLSWKPSATPRSVPGNGSDPNSAMPQALKRTTSLVRLSMSLDGKAKVTTSEKSSPSPPRSQLLPIIGPTPRPKSGLQRSQSAMEPNNKTSIESLRSSISSRRSMTGRSRDARTWEFYCDSDTRDALTIQAEREQSGSAVGAISLIRSRSNKTMTPNSNKRNAHQPKHESMKRLKSDDQQPQKPKLARAISSVARLQSAAGNAQKQAVKLKDKDPKSSSQPALYQSYDGDSDKENWEPGTQTSRIRRRRQVNAEQHTRMRRPVLEESMHVPSQSSSLDALMNRKATKGVQSKRDESSEKENSGPEDDEEVAKFMSGSSVPREVEDLDCVQNLLSLSQAVWQ